jgi:hypothetical protein
MHKHRPGSLSRQAQRQANKQHRQAKQVKKRRARFNWSRLKAGQAAHEPKAAPQAGSFLVCRFWEHLRLGRVVAPSRHQAETQRAARRDPDARRLDVWGL